MQANEELPDPADCDLCRIACGVLTDGSRPALKRCKSLFSELDETEEAQARFQQRMDEEYGPDWAERVDAAIQEDYVADSEK